MQLRRCLSSGTASNARNNVALVSGMTYNAYGKLLGATYRQGVAAAYTYDDTMTDKGTQYLGHLTQIKVTRNTTTTVFDETYDYSDSAYNSEGLW